MNTRTLPTYRFADRVRQLNRTERKLFLTYVKERKLNDKLGNYNANLSNAKAFHEEVNDFDFSISLINYLNQNPQVNVRWIRKAVLGLSR